MAIKHIEIQANNPAEVNSEIIEALGTVLTDELDDTSTMQGELHSEYAYADTIKSLTDRFKGLKIGYDKEFYRFKDTIVDKAMRAKFGSLDTQGVEKITSLPEDIFSKDSRIVDFSDFILFSGIKNQTIGDPFTNCSELEILGIPRNITTFYYSFTNCKKLKKVITWDALSTIKSRHGSTNQSPFMQGADLYFYDNLKEPVTDFHIPNSIVATGRIAMYGANIEILHIPTSVKTIDIYCFSDCKRLNTIIYEGTIEQLKSVDCTPKYAAFDGVPAEYVQCVDGNVPIIKGVPTFDV